MTAATLPKTHVRAAKRVRLSRSRTLAWLVTGVVRVPFYWLLAAFYPTPGLRIQARCFALGLRLLLRPRAPRALSMALKLLIMPMDSTRYFEFEYVHRALADQRISRLLDVSSPRLVPVLLALQNSGLSAALINPDEKDLIRTRELVDAAGLTGRCRLYGCLIADAPFERESFEAITCVSVLEHIPNDSAALRRMWEMLKPGGRLVLTVPCMAQACEQYIDHDEYGLLPKNGEGFVFWQRFYDSELLRQRVFSVLGPPTSSTVYGEKVAGSFFKNAQAKREWRAYPFWREPYMMARDYRYFGRVEDLPGDGVIGMTFVKQ
jgi:SAM-dependent methyltransferase